MKKKRAILGLIGFSAVLAVGLLLAMRGCPTEAPGLKPPAPDAPEAPRWPSGRADTDAVPHHQHALRANPSLGPSATNWFPADQTPPDFGLPINIVIEDVPPVPQRIAEPASSVE